MNFGWFNLSRMKEQMVIGLRGPQVRTRDPADPSLPFDLLIQID
jgi:hypothetical protein